MIVLLFLLAANLMLVQAARAESFYCGNELSLSTVDFTNSGGQQSTVEAAANRARLSAEGGAFGAENSSHAEVGFRFTSAVSTTVTAAFNGVLAVGLLKGTSNVNEGSIVVAVKVLDLTTDTELASFDAIEHSENGSFGTTTQQPVNALQFGAITLDAVLAADHEYAAFIRVDVRANGLVGSSDFRTGDRRVEIGGVTLTTESVDSDGDGLLDHWETNGFDQDCDPDNGIDVDLVAMGANPNHKDLFIEIDWMPGAEPTRGMTLALKETFDAAPKDAGGTDNPDNALGITVHVDAGNLIDPAAPEDSSGNGTCGDGIDNGSDGLTDGGDPDCLVGDVQFSDLGPSGGNLGRGTQVPVANITDLSTDQDGDGVVEFYETRNDNFDAARRQIFRYVISAPRKGSLLGEAELGGNDLLILKANETTGCNNPPAGSFPSGTLALTLIHELGHSLGLQHGGDAGSPNRKPNYVSVMNYAYTLGIKQNNSATSNDLDGDGLADCRIMDYSPPRVPGGRVSAPIPQPSGTLDETQLDETKRVDPSDLANRLTYFDQTAMQWTDKPINSRTNWDGDTATDETGVMSDIDNSGDLETISGFNDWDVIRLSQLDFEDSEDGPVNNLAQSIQVDDGDEILDIYRQTLATDLEVTKTLTSSIVVAGQPLDYLLTVRNNGPNRATFALEDIIPPVVEVVALPPGCAFGGGKIACTPAMINVGETVDFEVRLRLPADLECSGSQFIEVKNEAVVENVSGDDPKPQNNRAVHPGQALCINYEYSANFVCGEQRDFRPAPLTRGIYATTVNIHNPNDERVHFFKKLAITYPPAAQKPGKVLALGVDAMDYDEALKTQCGEVLRRMAEEVGEAVEFAEGFVVIQSPRSLDVTSVHTVTTAQTSIHTEDVRERLRKPPVREPDRETRERPDLSPVRYSCVPPGPGEGSRPKEIVVHVRNLGAAAAPASTTVTTFAPPGSLPVDSATPEIAPGETADVKVAIPSACPAACTFKARADGPEVIEELNEVNNEIVGECLPLPG